MKPIEMELGFDWLASQKGCLGRCWGWWHRTGALWLLPIMLKHQQNLLLYFLVLVPCYLEGPMLCADRVLMSLTRSVLLEPRLWLCGMAQGEITFFQGDITHQSLKHCHYSVLMWDTQTPEYQWARNLSMNIQEFLESYYYICPSWDNLLE